LPSDIAGRQFNGGDQHTGGGCPWRCASSATAANTDEEPEASAFPVVTAARPQPHILPFICSGWNVPSGAGAGRARSLSSWCSPSLFTSSIASVTLALVLCSSSPPCLALTPILRSPSVGGERSCRTRGSNSSSVPFSKSVSACCHRKRHRRSPTLDGSS